MDDDKFKTLSEKIDRAHKIIHDPEVQVVSFDIMDTLLVRPFFFPEDVFYYIESQHGVDEAIRWKGYAGCRVSAEKRVRERYKNSDLCKDPSLGEIYAEFRKRTGATAVVTEKLMATELEVELALCRPRLDIKRLYESAVRKNKIVIISSDMYLPVEYLQKMLHKCGYYGQSRLYVSCDIGVTKKHGEMFAYIQDDLKIKSRAVLHIGDNARSDVRMAEANGWRALHVDPPRDIVTDSTRGSLHGLLPALSRPSSLQSPSARLNFALIANNAMLDIGGAPSDKASYRIGQWLGRIMLGPFLLSLVLWIRRMVLRNGTERIVWLARDGFLPQKSWSIIQGTLGDNIESIYLPISRKLLIPYHLGEGDVERVLAVGYRPHMTVRHFVQKRFGEEGVSAFVESVGPQQYGVLRQPIHANYSLVADVLKKNRERLKRHYRPEAERIKAQYRCRIGNDRRVSVFDVGRKGTFQRTLAEITGEPLHGVYVVNSHEIYGNAPRRLFDSFLGLRDPLIREQNPDTVIYERMLAEDKGSFIGFDELGRATREDDETTPNTGSSIVETLQSGALAYVRDAVDIFGASVVDMEMEPEYASYALENWGRNQWAKECFGDVAHEDNLSDPDSRSLLEYFNNNTQSKKPERQGRAKSTGPSEGGNTRVALYCPAITRIRGGAERVGASVANYLSNKGYSVTIFTAGKKDRDITPVYGINRGISVCPVDVRDGEALLTFMDDYRPDVGLVLASGPVVQKVALAFEQRAIPYMLSERASPTESIDAYWAPGGRAQYNHVYGKANLIGLQFSSFSSEFPTRVRERVRIVPNPVDLPTEANAPRENVILCVGRIWFRQKRQDVLVRAFSQIARRRPEWVLKFYGTSYGTDGQSLSKLVTELGLSDRVQIHDAVETIYSEMERAKLLVIPSAFEGFPNVLAEAMARGVPAIGSRDCAGVNELIRHRRNGLLVEGSTPIDGASKSCRPDADHRAGEFELEERLAEALAMMIDDDDFREKAAGNARIDIAAYDASKILPLWESVVKELRELRHNKLENDSACNVSWQRHANNNDVRYDGLEESATVAGKETRSDIECLRILADGDNLRRMNLALEASALYKRVVRETGNKAIYGIARSKLKIV